MFECEGKVALITGALGVIGKAYTSFLSQNKIKGVALIDIQEESAAAAYLAEIHGTYGAGKYIYVKADTSDKSALRNAFDKTVQHFKQLDIVINNAGVSDEANYERCININFMGIMHGTTMALYDYLPKYKQSAGVIVNTASIAGVVPFPCPVYCISKHAVVSIGICYANDDVCTKQNIKIVSICPGPVASPIYDKLAEGILKGSSALHIEVAHSADFLGEALIQIMREGKGGSAWIVVDKKKPTLVDYSRLHADAGKLILSP